MHFKHIESEQINRPPVPTLVGINLFLHEQPDNNVFNYKLYNLPGFKLL